MSASGTAARRRRRERHRGGGVCERVRGAWGSLAIAGKAVAHLGPSVDVGTLGDEVVEAVAVACWNAWTCGLIRG
jgi:hypothetical protein